MLRIDSARLAAALYAIKPAYSKVHRSCPILDTVHLRMNHSFLALQGTDLNLFLGTEIATYNGRIPDTAVDYRGLVAAINPKDGDVVLSIDGDHLVIQSGGEPHRLRTMDPDKHPCATRTVYDTPDDGTFTAFASLYDDQLPLLYKAVVKAAARDEYRPVLAGVHFFARNGRLYAEATDGFRLARQHLGAMRDSVDLILPAPDLGRILSLRPDSLHLYQQVKATEHHRAGARTWVRYQVRKHKVYIGVTGNMPTVDAVFPDLDYIIPPHSPNDAGRSLVGVRAGVLKEAEKQTRRENGVCIIDAHKDLAYVQSETGAIVWDTDAAQFLKGRPQRFAINAGYGVWCASWCTGNGSDLVTFSVREHNQALVVAHDTVTALVMPMIARS